jgi:hypothetical protein
MLIARPHELTLQENHRSDIRHPLESELQQVSPSVYAVIGPGEHLSKELARSTRRKLCADLFEAYASTDCGQITTIGQDNWGNLRRHRRQSDLVRARAHRRR